MTTAAKSLVLFDGVCNLCNASVQFLIRRDPRGEKFQFASLQSAKAQEVLAQAHYPAGQLNTVLLVEGGKVYGRSTAALRLARKLPGLWPLLYGFIIVPPFIRDAVYNFIARNRYRWFGRQESCMIPTPELRNRFLDI